MPQPAMTLSFSTTLGDPEAIVMASARSSPIHSLGYSRPRVKRGKVDRAENTEYWQELTEIKSADNNAVAARLGCSKERVRFNIRGVRYEVEAACLQRAPKTSRFANLAGEEEQYDTAKEEYYFNRDPYIFNSFINFLVNGDLHFRTCVCVDELEREMTFWGMEDHLLQHCCWERAENEKARREAMRLVEREWFGMALEYEEKKEYEIPFREKLWLFLEEPASSLGAQLWSLFILVLVFTSNVILGLETIPALRRFVDAEAEHNYTSGVVSEHRVIYRLYYSTPNIGLVGLDITCFVLMTLELLLRFVVSKAKVKFCLTALNIIDFVALLPMWISLPMYGIRQAQNMSPSATTAFYVIGGMRLLRTFRAIRIMKSYKPLKILLLAWKASYKEMLLLVILVEVVAVVFGNLLFISEIHTDKVATIPDAVWWAIITITTVGYGDIAPETIPGAFIGAVCAISGIVVVAMPVPVIVANFSFYYDCLKSILLARSLRTKKTKERQFRRL